MRCTRLNSKKREKKREQDKRLHAHKIILSTTQVAKCLDQESSFFYLKWCGMAKDDEDVLIVCKVQIQDAKLFF